MGASYSEIGEDISLLYCMNKEPRPSCVNKECENGKCICMDEEQLALLGFLAGIPFILEIDEQKYKFVEHEEDVDDLRCNVQCGHHKKLLCCREKDADILKQLGNHFVNQKVKFESIVSCLPIIQSINMQEQIDLRNSICYLCLFSEDAPDFIKGMIKAFIQQMIVCIKYDLNVVEIKVIFENIILKISDLFVNENYSLFRKKVLRVTEQYIDSFIKENTLCVLANSLDQLIDETLEREEKFKNSDSILRYIFESDEGGYEEIIHLFRILKKIVRISGEEFSDACIKFFEDTDLMPQHDLYDELERTLDNIEKWERGDQKIILAKVADFFESK